MLLDFKNADILQTDIVFSQGDYGHAAINISCRDGDETIKDAMSATIAFNTPNGNIVTGDLAGEAGEYKYTFKGSEFQAPGKITAAVSLKWADGRLSSCVFTFKCRAIPSGSEVPAGTYLTEVDKVVEEAKNKILELQDLIDKLQPGIGSAALTKADLQNDLLQDTPGIKALDAVQGSVIKKLIDDIKEQTPTGVVTEEALNNVLKSYIKSDQIINNLLATVVGNALDATQGKILNDKITQLNSDLSGRLNKELSTSVLEYAEKAEAGFRMVKFSGASYTGNDMPTSTPDYKYGAGTIIKRHSSVISVILWGASDRHVPIFNLRTDEKWSGWKKFDGTPVT